MGERCRGAGAGVRRIRLEEETYRSTEAMVGGAGEPSIRSLVEDDALSVTLVTLTRGSGIEGCRVAEAVTVQPVYGAVRVRVGGRNHGIEPGDLLAIPAGVAHTVRTERGGVFLLTRASGGRDGADRGAAAEVER
ncbi:MAG: hypothetical protein ACOC8B_08585 [Gemmatimonadota bacterium]